MPLPLQRNPALFILSWYARRSCSSLSELNRLFKLGSKQNTRAGLQTLSCQLCQITRHAQWSLLGNLTQSIVFRFHAPFHGALTQILRTEQCQLVLWTPHQGPETYSTTSIDHICHAFTDAEESNVVHLVAVCRAFWFQFFKTEQIVQTRQQTEYLLTPANIGSASYVSLPAGSDITTCPIVIT